MGTRVRISYKMGTEKKVMLTKRFMDEHGARKDALKVNWITYMKILQNKQKTSENK